MNEIHPNRRLDLNLLRVFQAVYQERHLGRAANRLFLTPSAVSHALGRLRDHFSDPLFQRHGRSMLPTPLCQRLAPELLEALLKLEQVLQQVDSFDPARSRQQFTLGLHDAMEAMVLPRLMANIHKHAPHIGIRSVRTSRSDIPRELTSGRVQIVVNVSQPMSNPIRHCRLMDAAYCLVARQGHGVLKNPKLGNYLAAEHVVVSTRRDGLAAEDYVIRKLGKERNVVLRCQSYHSAVAIVQDSDLLLTMPKGLAQQITGHLNTQITELPFVTTGLELDMYWHANTEHDPANRWLRSRLLQLARAQAHV